MIEVYRDPNLPYVLRVVIYDDPEDENPASIREINLAYEIGEEVDDVPNHWIKLSE